MTNSAHIKDDHGKYEKLPICPVCGKKVHINENDVNLDNWSFAGGGDFTHDHCLTREFTNESGEYWNGTELVTE